VKRVNGVSAPCVKPVNRLAENVLYDLYASESPSPDVALSCEPDDGARGVIFQRQVFMFFAVELFYRDLIPLSIVFCFVLFRS
jgi:hypothetical protein